MKSAAITFLMAILAAVAISSIHPHNSIAKSYEYDAKSFGEPQYFVTECGGHLEAAFASIAYKTDSSILQNERCVWTIRAPSASSYLIDVLSYGMEPQTSEMGIIATCLQNMTVTMPNVVINGTGAVSVPTACPVLVITFYSGANVSSSRGFALVYTAMTGSTGIAATSKHYVLTEKEGHIRYPLNAGQNFSNYETSTFVFPPPENIFSPGRETLIAYTREKQTIGDCGGRIRLYRFYPSTRWTHNDTSGSDEALCADVEYKIWTGDDLVMAIFRSANYPVGPGFHITYTHLPR